ncbi:MAG TPA: DoxX family membrane protein [Anaeromyxobacteraceae bacterium]|nr:DoxX family membrane protein [Anaeromyxobacteraceae bacterium]
MSPTSQAILSPAGVRDDGKVNATTDEAIRERRTLAVIRIAIGAMFVWVFFENLLKGAYTPAGYRGVVQYYLEKGTAPGVWKGVMSFAASHAAVAGPLQAASELVFGIALVTGTASRLAAAAAAGFLFTLWLSELGAAWIWELLIPTITAAALAATRPGRTWGLDALFSRKWPKLPIW